MITSGRPCPLTRYDIAVLSAETTVVDVPITLTPDRTAHDATTCAHSFRARDGAGHRQMRRRTPDRGVLAGTARRWTRRETEADLLRRDRA
jgi:hypothetical protein